MTRWNEKKKNERKLENETYTAVECVEPKMASTRQPKMAPELRKCINDKQKMNKNIKIDRTNQTLLGVEPIRWKTSNRRTKRQQFQYHGTGCLPELLTNKTR